MRRPSTDQPRLPARRSDRAVGPLGDTPLNLCVHTIFGFPWETRDMMLAQAHEINRFPQVGFVKLHHLHIVKGSILAAR